MQTPDEFLVHQFHLNPEVVLANLTEQAHARQGIARLLETHEKTVPAFTQIVRPYLLRDTLV